MFAVRFWQRMGKASEPEQSEVCSLHSSEDEQHDLNSLLQRLADKLPKSMV